MKDPAHPTSSVEQHSRTADGWTPRYRQARAAYLLIALVLIAAYPLSQTWAQLIIRFGASLAAIPALFVGMRHIRRDRRAPWVLLLAAVTLINLGNALRLYPGGRGTTASQILGAAGNLVVLLGAMQLIRQQRHANATSIIDTSIVGLAVGGLLWDLVIEPNLVPSSTTHVGKVAVFIIIFALSGVLGALVQMIIQRRVPALRPLVVALALALVADTITSITTQPAATTIARMMIIGAYTAIGLFGLDPTAQQLVTPGPARPDRLSHTRLVLLGLAVAALPIVIGAQQLAGAARHSVLLIVSSATITILVMAHIGQISAQRDHAEADLRHQATHDTLTGLPNRTEFTKQVNQQLSADRHTAIIFGDLDRFKIINDLFGHATGDQVLVETAQRLRSCVRADDLVARLGGDEFVILLRNTTSDEAHTINQRIINALADPIVISDQVTTIGITTGIAFADNGTDADDLIGRADHAMYLAKTSDPTGHNP